MGTTRITRRAVALPTAVIALVATLSLGVAPLAGPSAATTGPALASTSAHQHHEHSAAVTSRRAFHDAMRKLWEDHITWTRLFIVSFAHDLPDLAATQARLLQNQADIGDAIRPFYGDAAGDELTSLLTEHITTAATLLAAAKDGDDEAFAAAHDAWYANGRAIARFLAAANPDEWRLREMRSMMREHLDLTLTEAADRLAGDYAKDVQDYDAVHAAILEMADMLSGGIIRQFPGHFARH